MPLSALNPTLTFKNWYDNYNNLVEFFNNKEPIIDSIPLEIDTSLCSEGLFGYIDGDSLTPAVATSQDTFADGFCIISDVDGKIIQNGIAYNAQVETGITITIGDILYLTADPTKAGKVTNVPTNQFLGKALTNSVEGYCDIWYKNADANVTLKAVDNYVDGTDFTTSVTTELTLSVYPPDESFVNVIFDGVVIHHTAFTLSGNVITFGSPIVATNVEIVSSFTENQLYITGVVAANSISASKLADNSTKAIANLSGGAAGKLIEYTGIDAAQLIDISAAGKALIDDATAADQRTTLDVFSKSEAQPVDGDLTAIAALTGTGVARRTATNTWELATDLITNDNTATLTNKTLDKPIISEDLIVITTNTTALKGKTYIINNTLNLTLPITPTVGDIVGIINRSYVNSYVLRNGEKIMGLAEDMKLNLENASFKLKYSGSTLGWLIS